MYISSRVPSLAGVLSLGRAIKMRMSVPILRLVKIILLPQGARGQGLFVGCVLRWVRRVVVETRGRFPPMFVLRLLSVGTFEKVFTVLKVTAVPLPMGKMN